MMKIFGLLAVPLGYLLRWIYTLIPSYFVAIFLFTFVLRVVMFPLSIKTQKGQADRARLAPRIERLQKKYANDKQKMAQKQQELFEKEGVSMTGGCLPMVVQMLVLFSIIAVIYKPLTYVQRVNETDLNTCITAVSDGLVADGKMDRKKADTTFNKNSYYSELNLMQYVDTYSTDITDKLVASGKTEAQAGEILDKIRDTEQQFNLFGVSLLEMPNKDGIKPNWLWLVAIASGLAAFLSSLLSMHYNKGTMPEQQAGGCSTNSMMYVMPIFSLVIAFGVPGGVAVYWVFSNLLALVQTVILNQMYNPAKIRAQAEAEYAERRRKKAEDKERLRQARLAEQAAWQQEENEKRLAKEGKLPRPPKKEKLAEESEEPAEENEPAEE